jgi:CBS domain-containing protein
LAPETLNVFSEDIAMMFDTEVAAQQLDISTGTIKDLKDTYKKLAAVCSVTAHGAINGNFHVIFDREGLFTLAGTFVMQPEQIITKNRKSGTEDDANEIGDALSEVGNLFVGSCDRVFREGLEDHGHFVQAGTFIGNPWTGSDKKIGIAADEELLILEFEMTVDPLEPFKCAMAFSKTMFDPPPEPEEEPEPEASAEEAPPAEETPAAVEEAPAAAEETPVEAAAEAPAPEPEAPAEEAAQEPEAPLAEPAAEEPAEAEAPEEAPTDEAPAEEAQAEPAAEPAEAPAPAPAPEPGPVSEAITKITSSSAVLPGQDIPAAEILTKVTAAQIMRTDVAWASPDDTVERITAVMQQYDTGYILIGKDLQLEGIVSKSDVRGALSPYLQSMFIKWRGPMDLATLQIKAQWVMNRPVRTVRPDATLWTVMRTMTSHGGRCMPVVDQDGKVHGILTIFDIFKAMLNATPEAQTSGRTPESPPLT